MHIDSLNTPAAGLPARAAPAQSDFPVKATQPAHPQPDAVTLEDAIKAANAAVKSLSNSMEFMVDLQSGRTIVRIVDTETRQLIRQLPSEEMLAISRVLDRLQGLLITSQA